MKKIAIFMLLLGLTFASSTSLASLTKEQSEDVASFATTFIEKGNQRRDQNGYPLLVYALSNNWNTCVEIRSKGYKEQLYYIKNNNYHKRNGYYLELGNKWCMDCGDFVDYVYKTTLGLDLMNPSNEDPWHITDFRDDANKGANSKYFEYVYKNVAISSIDEKKLQKGDIVLRFGSKDNHGLIYVGENMQTAHASRNGIKYSLNPVILGFEIVQLNKFYKTSTIVSIVRVKDGVIPEEQIVNSFITWPDTGEYEAILSRAGIDYEIYEEPDITLIENASSTLEKTLIDAEFAATYNISDYENINKINDNISKSTIIDKNIYDWMTQEIKKQLEKIAKDDENLENA